MLFKIFLILSLLAPGYIEGYASGYAPGVMEGVVVVRFANGWWPNPPPYGWYMAQGAVAVEDCSRVGEMAVIEIGGRRYLVLIADCGERNKPGEGGHWMRENNIVVELDWRLWERLTAEHGRPLPVRLYD